MKKIVIDNETSGLNPRKDKVLMTSITDCDTGATQVYAPDELPLGLLQDETVIKVGQHLRFDIRMLLEMGVEVRGPWRDTKLEAQLLDENRPLGLKDLILEIAGPVALQKKRNLDRHLAELSTLYKEKFDMGSLADPRVNRRIVEEYCAEDTINTRTVHLHQTPKLTPGMMDYYLNELLPTEKVLMKMERRGVRVNLTRLAAVEAALKKRLAERVKALNEFLAPEIKVVTGIIQSRNKKDKDKEFNWNSTDHRIWLFYGQLGLGTYVRRRTDAGKRTMQAKILALHENEIPEGRLKQALKLYFERQKTSTLMKTFVGSVDKETGLVGKQENGRIYGEFYQVGRDDEEGDDEKGGTRSGRLGSKNPNLENLPERSDDYWDGGCIKDCLEVDDPTVHIFGHFDYSQIELRAAAHLSQDPVLLGRYRDNADLHTETAELLNRQLSLSLTRNDGKILNFGGAYGAGAFRYCELMGWNPHDKEKFRVAEAIWEYMTQQRYPVLCRWQKALLEKVYRQGYVEAITGRRRHLPEIRSGNPYERRKAEKKALNFVCQTLAASICKRAMVRLSEMGYDVVNQIHDDIISQLLIRTAEERAAEAAKVMSTLYPLSLPTPVEIKFSPTFLKKLEKRPKEVA